MSYTNAIVNALLASTNKNEEAVLTDMMINNIKHNTNADKWVDSAKMAEDKQLYEWAYKCYTKALKLNKDDKSLQKKRALCALKVEKPSMGKGRYLNIMRRKVLSGTITEEYFMDAIEISDIYIKWGKYEISEEILHNVYRSLRKPSVALQLMITYNEDKKYQNCIQFYTMNVSQLKLCDIFIDIKCQHTIAMINCNKNIPSEDKYFEYLLKDISVNQIMVCAHIANCLFAQKNHKYSLIFYQKVKQLDENNKSTLLIYPNIIHCYKHLNLYKKASEELQYWKVVDSSSEVYTSIEQSTKGESSDRNYQ
jgi:tetratricopeptide (TPR) repeat protein